MSLFREWLEKRRAKKAAELKNEADFRKRLEADFRKRLEEDWTFKTFKIEVELKEEITQPKIKHVKEDKVPKLKFLFEVMDISFSVNYYERSIRRSHGSYGSLIEYQTRNDYFDLGIFYINKDLIKTITIVDTDEVTFSKKERDEQFKLKHELYTWGEYLSGWKKSIKLIKDKE